MIEQMVVIQHEDGRQGAVRLEDFGNPKLADNFKGARILRFEDGTEYHGPTTPEGLARKEEREEAAEEEEEPKPERTTRRQAPKE